MTELVINEPDRVIFVEDENGDEEWPAELIHGAPWKGSVGYEAFTELFTVPEWARHILADPNEDWYQGANWMALIERKSDGKLFGYQYWESGGKYGEPLYEANGEDHGLPGRYDKAADTYLHYWVWLPVEPFTVTGYKIKEST